MTLSDRLSALGEIQRRGSGAYERAKRLLADPLEMEKLKATTFERVHAIVENGGKSSDYVLGRVTEALVPYNDLGTIVAVYEARREEIRTLRAQFEAHGNQEQGDLLQVGADL